MAEQTGSRPSIYLSDSLSPGCRVRTLEETVRLETRTKTLNPKWFEGMLRHGFSGVAEIKHHVTNTFGWSATADGVDGWIYDEVAATFALDEQMLDRLRSLNPHSAHARWAVARSFGPRILVGGAIGARAAPGYLCQPRRQARGSRRMMAR
ncbi:MAG: cobaltochelatase subunit CobN [Acidobacteriota bacterium]